MAVSDQSQASGTTLAPLHREPQGNPAATWNLHAAGTMTAGAAEELAFVGSQFGSTVRPGVALQSSAIETTTDPLRLGSNSNQQENRSVTSGDDGDRGRAPMERFLVCGKQPLQITVARPPTKDGKESSADKGGLGTKLFRILPR